MTTNPVYYVLINMPPIRHPFNQSPIPVKIQTLYTRTRQSTWKKKRKSPLASSERPQRNITRDNEARIVSSFGSERERERAASAQPRGGRVVAQKRKRRLSPDTR